MNFSQSNLTSLLVGGLAGAAATLIATRLCRCSKTAASNASPATVEQAGNPVYPTEVPEDDKACECSLCCSLFHWVFWCFSAVL